MGGWERESGRMGEGEWEDGRGRVGGWEREGGRMGEGEWHDNKEVIECVR